MQVDCNQLANLEYGGRVKEKDAKELKSRYNRKIRMIIVEG